MKASRLRKWIVGQSWALCLLLGIGLLLGGASCQRFKMAGAGMEPALKAGDIVYADKGAYTNQQPQRGDIIVFKANGVDRVMRIIGLPGETVTISQGTVFINGAPLDEPYLASGTKTESATKEFQVTADSYFVLGDNRGASNDSRSPNLGLVQRSQIVGKVSL